MRSGATLVSLLFNTRARRRTWSGKDRPTAQEMLAEFLHFSRIEEMPSLLLIAFGFEPYDEQGPMPDTVVSWECLSLWASNGRVPEILYEDLVFEKFNDACNKRNLLKASQLCAEFEDLQSGPVYLEFDDETDEGDELRRRHYYEGSNRLFNHQTMGVRRLTLMQLRLWQLRHPEPPKKG